MITLVVMTGKVWGGTKAQALNIWSTQTQCGDKRGCRNRQNDEGWRQAYLYTAHIFTNLRVDQSTPHNIYIYIYTYLYMHMYVNACYIQTHIYIYIFIYLFPTQQENGSEPEIVFVGWWSRDMAQHATTIRWRITWTNPVNSWCLSLGLGFPVFGNWKIGNTYN